MEMGRASDRSGQRRLECTRFCIPDFASQILMVSSALPLAMNFPSSEKETDVTERECPLNWHSD
jgi:hypothetical protein